MDKLEFLTHLTLMSTCQTLSIDNFVEKKSKISAFRQSSVKEAQDKVQYPKQNLNALLIPF